MKIGYVRVSTVEQNTIFQEVFMEKLDAEETFIDKISRENRDRPELWRMLDFIRWLTGSNTPASSGGSLAP